MKYGKKKINETVVVLALIVSLGISYCLYLLVSEIVNQGAESSILTKKEREAINSK